MGTGERKQGIVGMFFDEVARPLAKAADPLSWVFFATFLAVAVLAGLFKFNVITSPGVNDVFGAYAWIFLYGSWTLLVLSTVCPLIRVTKKRGGIPIGMLISVAIFHLIAFILISVFLLSTKYPDNPATITGLLAACAGAAMVGVGWLVQHNSAARAARRTHTFNLLMQSRLSKEFQDNVKGREKLFPSRTKIVAEDIKVYRRQGLNAELKILDGELATFNVSAAGETERNAKALEIAASKIQLEEKFNSLQCVKYLLNFYEFLSAGIVRSELDEGLLYHTLSDIAKQLLEDAQAIVDAARAVDGPQVFEHFTDVVGGWRDEGFHE